MFTGCGKTTKDTTDAATFDAAATDTTEVTKAAATDTGVDISEPVTLKWYLHGSNVTVLSPQAGQGTDFWDKFKAYYGSAGEIPILGWSFNSAVVTNEMGALSNVAAEYALALNTGTIDPEEKLPEYIQKLKDNGIDKVVAEANTQLEAFLAAKWE